MRKTTFGAREALGLVAVLLLTATVPAFAGAGGGFQPLTTTATNVEAALVAIGLIVLTIAIMVAGYKMVFSGARFGDVAYILIGGTFIGGATTLAGWIHG